MTSFSLLYLSLSNVAIEVLSMLLFVYMTSWCNFNIVTVAIVVPSSPAAFVAGSGKTAAFMVPILSQICVRGCELMSQNSVRCR